MEISSPAFQSGNPIPSKYTCEGPNISIPIEWSGIPEDAKSLAMIMDDPDAPMVTWVHWVVYNISPSRSVIPENQPITITQPGGGQQGRNSWKRTGYGGPCPPKGTHHYFFKLYALDIALDSNSTYNKKDLMKAMQGHILAEAEFFGIYKRSH